MVFASEFCWGILTGAVLTVIGAYVMNHLQNRRREWIVRRFCRDAATNLSEHFQGMDALKERARRRGIPYTRFIRELMEREIARREG